ncbi:MAG: ABC transporter ATP-binding protein [Henriciella sp.]
MRLFRQFFAAQIRWFLLGTLFAVITAACASAYAGILGFVGNQLQAAIETKESEFGWIIVGTIGIVLLASGRALSLYLMTICNNTGVQRALVDVQAAQFNALTDGDYQRLTAVAAGGFVSRFINDVNALRDAGLRFANNFTKSIFTIIGAFGYMLYHDWRLTLILLIVYPVAFGPVIALGNRIRKRAKIAQTQIGEVTSLLNEGFQSARIVKAYSLEAYQRERAKLGFIERSRLFLKVLTDKAAVDPILEVTGGVAMAGILAFSAWQIATGASTLGDLLGVIAAIGIATPELRALGTLNAVAQEGGAAADRVFDVLDDKTLISDAPGAVELAAVRGRISFKNVSFNYPDGSPALNNLSFEIEPGETVALVGPSGAGKSTVFNLILRLFDATSGEILIDGAPLKQVSLSSLRGAMALVSQDTALFDDTIKANIAFGRLDANIDEIMAAAIAANAHGFIMELKDGYDSQVGEGGRNLSGGQRQRVALARAIIRQAPILLLDEATSALDSENEAKVQAALREFTQDRTSLIVAHRLSTVRKADRILVIEDGQVVETGSHTELMAVNGVYKRLVELQLN